MSTKITDENGNIVNGIPGPAYTYKLSTDDAMRKVMADYPAFFGIPSTPDKENMKDTAKEALENETKYRLPKAEGDTKAKYSCSHITGISTDEASLDLKTTKWIPKKKERIATYNGETKQWGYTEIDKKVNNPPHYNNHPSKIECIQITRHMNFNLGNAVKYIWRADLKNDAIEDLKKAAWYIQDEIQRREK